MKMKKLNPLFIFLILFLSVNFVSAQIDDGNPPPNNYERPQNGFSLLRELGLNQDQIRQIRIINRDIKPLRQEALERLETARQKLDESVYSDSADEAAIQANIREVNEAQAEMLKLRIRSELAIRKVLTPQQLSKFREIRRNFAERKDQRQTRRERNQNRRNPKRNRNP
jgi:Spy/CpxP family protein refolding chaperone